MDLIKGRRPVMGEMKAEEVERLRKTAVADLAKLAPSRASVSAPCTLHFVRTIA